MTPEDEMYYEILDFVDAYDPTETAANFATDFLDFLNYLEIRIKERVLFPPLTV